MAFPPHPFQPGLYVSVYNHPYAISLRVREVIEDSESLSVLLLWRHEDILDIRPPRDLRKGHYGCHVLVGEGVADYSTHERLCLEVGCPRPTLIFVETRPYYTLDYGVTPEAGYDRDALLNQLRVHARAERALLRRLSVPTETLALPGS